MPANSTRLKAAVWKPATSQVLKRKAAEGRRGGARRGRSGGRSGGGMELERIMVRAGARMWQRVKNESIGHFLLTAPGVRQFYRPSWKHQRGYRDDVITFGGRGIPNGQPCYFVVHAF